MQIEKTGSSELTITDNIKSIEDSRAIKHAVDSLVAQGNARILLRIATSFSMTSAVIGHLMKLVCEDHIQLSIVIEDSRLYSLLDSLDLLGIFGVSLAGRVSDRPGYLSSAA